jgi:hypothetical protein
MDFTIVLFLSGQITVMLVVGMSFVRNFCMLTTNSKYKVYASSITHEEGNFVNGSCNSVSVLLLLCPSHCSQISQDLYKMAS